MLTLKDAATKVANGERICPRCGKDIMVDKDENNIHFCLPAPEPAQGSAFVVVAGIDCSNPAAVVVGRQSANLQKAMRLMREKYKIHIKTEWALIQFIVP